MYNALSVAHYVIDYCNHCGHGISNLKLQKILYFVQAEFLVSSPFHAACFTDQIEAWDLGPVVPSVYHHYKVYGSAIIPSVSCSNDPLNGYYQPISNQDQVRINEIVQLTFDYTASELVQITHNQSPWKDAYRPGYNNVITNEAILSFFGG